jgi:hypothetical protein
MKYGLNDDAVKRIAAVAFHGNKGDNHHTHVSAVYHSLNTPEGIMAIENAHTTDAMQHKFTDNVSENRFKRYLAKASAINRGTLDPVQIELPKPKGKRRKF